jgi:hypothetical protein
MSAIRPLSLARAIAWSLLGTLIALAFFAWLWEGAAGLVVGGLLAALWVIVVFAWRDARKDELALLERIRGRVSHQDPVLRLAVALAQPIRSIVLAMPIPAPTRRFDGWSLYEPGQLPPPAKAHAAQLVNEWRAQVREQASEPLPFDDFASLATLLLDAPLDGPHEWTAGTSARLCWRLNLLLCGMDTSALSAEAGRALLAPAVHALQSHHADWASYAADLKQQRWDFVRRNPCGPAAPGVQFRDLFGKPLSPWALTPLDLPL